jgi:glutathione S-transferase
LLDCATVMTPASDRLEQHVIEIWGRRNSVNVQKVLWIADELGVSYRHTQIGGPFGGTREPEYLAVNPNGLVPALRDDAVVVWESNVIVRYLCARYGAELLGDPSQRYGQIEAWMDWELNTIQFPMRTLFVSLVRTPAAERDAAALEKARGELYAGWALLDRHLANCPYVGGERFSAADIPAGSLAHRWFELGGRGRNTPHLAAWFARLAAREAYRRHVMIELS